MEGKVHIDLHGVQETLLLPLWGRAVETQKNKPLLVDGTAAQIVDRIDYDFTTIASNISLITQLAWIARSLHTDRTVREFLRRHPRGTIVNIGCGMDTTFERVDNGNLFWYDLDLPDVIALRKTFITENERRHHIASSFLDEAWTSGLGIKDSVLFLAGGIFYYFEEDQVKRFFRTLARLFPGSELFFDAASPLGVKTANKVVIKAGGMDQASYLKWGIESARDMRSWDPRITVVEEFPMFKGIKRQLSAKAMIGTFISDRLRIMFMVHLAFSK